MSEENASGDGHVVDTEVYAEYATGATFVRYDARPSNPMAKVDFALKAFGRHHGPSAVGTRPSDPKWHPRDILELVPETREGSYLYDAERREVRPLSEEEKGWAELPYSPGIRYRVTGQPVRLRASISAGLARADGQAAASPETLLSGLLRLDRSGRPLVEADAPLHLQLVTLNRHESKLARVKFANEFEREASRAHIKHLMVLTNELSQSVRQTFESWVDRQISLMLIDAEINGKINKQTYSDADASLSSYDISEESSSCESKDIIAILDLPPNIVAHPASPGMGIFTKELDRAMSRMGWRFRDTYFEKAGGFTAAADLSSLPGGTRARIEYFKHELLRNRTWRSENPSYGTFQSRKIMISECDGSFAISAQPINSKNVRGKDPLLTENMDAEPALSGLPQRAHADTLGALSLLDWLPDPSALRHFRMQALKAAHAEGSTLADLGAAYAAAGAWPKDDLLAQYRLLNTLPSPALRHKGPDALYEDGLMEHEAAAERLSSLGGMPSRRLVQLMQVASSLPARLLSRDAELLCRAVEDGATLLDLAAEAYTHDRRPDDPELDVGDATPGMGI